MLTCKYLLKDSYRLVLVFELALHFEGQEVNFELVPVTSLNEGAAFLDVGSRVFKVLQPQTSVCNDQIKLL